MEIESTASDVDGESSAKWGRVVAYVSWYRSRPSWLLVAADDRNKGGKEGRGRALDKMESFVVLCVVLCPSHLLVGSRWIIF